MLRLPRVVYGAPHKAGSNTLAPGPRDPGGEAMSINPQEGSQPTVVLVHGGFADGSGWQGVYNELKDDYSVRIVQEPNLSHQGDVEATKMITGAQSEPVILVGHSYGGAVITEAGKAPQEAALLYIPGLAPAAGLSGG